MSETVKTAAAVPLVKARGAEIPALGFGTWELKGDVARRMVERALDVGYRHIDTARMYRNEREVGRAIEKSGVDRGEIFLTTKIWPDEYRPEDFRAAVKDSLSNLRTDHVDLLMLHWPKFQAAELEETLELLHEAREAGQTRHVGVCNFNSSLLDRALDASPAPLAALQVEYHPHLSQEILLDLVRGHGMVLTAYSPLGRGEIPGDRALAEIGARHGRSAAQVAIRWLLQQPKVIAIPRTSNPDHLRENFDVFDFELSEEEMDAIFALARPDGRVIDPEGLAPAWD